MNQQQTSATGNLWINISWRCTGWILGLLAVSGSLSGWTQDEPRIETSESKEFVLLFNGQDLSGWKRVNTAESTWTVRDGMLVCSGKPIGELRTEKMYQNFILELEWRHLVPKGNAGVFVWADDITAQGVPFHRSIEVQVLENAYGNTPSYTTHGDIFPIHGARMTPINGRGGSRAFPIENRSRPSPEWNHYRIECRDGEISLAVNGKVVTRGKDCLPRRGYICLESEGGVVHYRNIRIRELPDTPIAESQIAVADRGYRCLYEGIDFANWKVAGEWKANDWRINFGGSQPGRLVSREVFGDAGFIIDFRSGEHLPEFEYRGLKIRPADWDAKLLAGGTGWNRLQIEGRDGVLTMSINDQPVPGKEKFLTEQGPLIIQALGACELANLYVRP